jgi:hypothetical protein
MFSGEEEEEVAAFRVMPSYASCAGTARHVRSCLTPALILRLQRTDAPHATVADVGVAAATTGSRAHMREIEARECPTVPLARLRAQCRP